MNSPTKNTLVFVLIAACAAMAAFFLTRTYFPSDEQVERRPNHDGPPGAGEDAVSLLSHSRIPIDADPNPPLSGLSTPGGATGEVVLLVADQSLVGIPGATISVLKGNSELIFNADAFGLLALPVDDVAGARVAATAPTFGRSSADVDARPEPEYLIQLSPDTEISGRVEMLDGEPVPDGAKAFAWVEGVDACLDDPYHKLVASSLALVADIEQSGAFRLSGLCEGRKYGLTAFGAGIYVPVKEEIRQILGPQNGLLIKAGYIGSAKIDIPDVTPGIASIISNSVNGLPNQEVPTQSSLELDKPEGCVYLSSRSWGLRLSGIKGASDFGKMLPRYVAVGAPSKALVRFDGRFSMHVGLLGSGGVDFTVHAVSRPEDVPVYVPDFEAVDLPLGELVCEVGSPLSTPIPSYHPAPHRVILRRVGDPESRSLDLTARRIPGEPLLLRAGLVPVGDYEVWLYNSTFNWTAPGKGASSVLASVRENEVARARFAGISTGRLKVGLVGPESFAYSGVMNVELWKLNNQGQLSSGAKVPTIFPRPPATWDLVPPGEYFLQIYGKRVMGYDRNRIPVTVEEGRETVLELMLSE